MLIIGVCFGCVSLFLGVGGFKLRLVWLVGLLVFGVGCGLVVVLKLFVVRGGIMIDSGCLIFGLLCCGYFEIFLFVYLQCKFICMMG